MEGGPPMFTQSFTSSVLLWKSLAFFTHCYRTVTYSGPTFQTVRSSIRRAVWAPNPGPKPGLGCSAFARRY